jgi:urease accessory protein
MHSTRQHLETAMIGQRCNGLFKYFTLICLLMAASALPAVAHHPLGGATPTTFLHGLLSGIGHPVLGFDHLAFIVAAGVASAFVGLRYMAPAIFIGGTLIGCLAALNASPPAQLEMLVAASVALIGIMVLSGRSIPSPVYLCLFAIAGLCHGAAFAGAMVGAEQTPIAAYLIGLALVQYAVAAGMTWATLHAWKATSTLAIQPRLAGAVVTGVGLTFLLEHAEKLVFGVV